MMEIYLDNCLTIGSDEGKKKVIEYLKKLDFDLNIEENLEDYLSCHIEIHKENRIAWIQQSYLSNNLKTKFGEEEMAMLCHETPGVPQFKFVRPNDED
jgi:hypothetical protein